MPCPTCDHTLAGIGTEVEGGRRFWHCERCGTLAVVGRDGRAETYRPKLVERCRGYRKAMLAAVEASGDFAYQTLWATVGIREAIDRPENRR